MIDKIYFMPPKFNNIRPDQVKIEHSLTGFYISTTSTDVNEIINHLGGFMLIVDFLMGILLLN